MAKQVNAVISINNNQQALRAPNMEKILKYDTCKIRPTNVE